MVGAQSRWSNLLALGLLVSGIGLASCAEDEACSDPSCLRPGPRTCMALGGVWSGTWAAQPLPVNGDATVTLEQRGCLLSGTASFSGATCLSGANVDVVVNLRSIEGRLTSAFDDNEVEVDLVGESNEAGDVVSLSFTVTKAEGRTARLCRNLTGTIQLQR